MSEEKETVTGIQLLHTNHYLTCSSGLTPAKMSSPQSIAKTSEGYYYLVSTGKATTSVGDFCCRWTVVLAAAIAAAGIVTGGAVLVALAAVAVAASMAMCGGLAAPFREWTNYNTKKSFGARDAYSLTAKAQMTCPIGGVVTYAPGITGFWSALAYTARNTTWALFEGFMWGKLAGAGGSFIKAFGGTATASVKTALANFLTLQASSRAIAVVDQVAFEGMLRNGKSLPASGEEAVSGLTIFEQPFVHFYQRVKDGYYTGGYAANPADTNGHGGGAMLTDLYYMGLSVMGMKAMLASAKTNPNIPITGIKAVQDASNKFIKGTLFERKITVYRTQGGELPNASQHRIIIDENGNISIKGNGMLYVTLDDINHQIYFYEKRGGAEKNAEIASFKIPRSLAKEIKQNSVPQDLGKSNPGKPQLSDETKSSGAYGLPKEYIQKLREQAIKGSGKIQQPGSE